MIAALIVLIMLSAFFSASETAYSSLNMIRLKSRAEDGDKQAAKVLALAERYDSLLSTILIGNNIVNIGASSLATVLFSRLLGNAYGPTASTIVMTLLVLTFGEITPKSMAKEMPESCNGLCAGAWCPCGGIWAAELYFWQMEKLFGQPLLY
ncbi:CNNM domain-containing protein [Gemmiger qucibialis]|uniref:CNNM domain-containing protein n=1 Tax=Gemmiger qucibialis TaxID=2997294 RepID=UPI002FD970D1